MGKIISVTFIMYIISFRYQPYIIVIGTNNNKNRNTIKSSIIMEEQELFFLEKILMIQTVFSFLVCMMPIITTECFLITKITITA